MATRKIIVNADDLGWSVGVTDGILQAHRRGILTSATLAANMPDAERAADLAAAETDLGVGVHLNVCQGRPLSQDGAKLAEADGVMRLKGPAMIRRCIARPRLVAAALAECEAQILWALNHGIVPTHLDSHRHVHAYRPLFAGVVRLADKYGIRFVRWPSEKLPDGAWPTAPAKQARTARLLRWMCGLTRTKDRRLCATVGTWGVTHTGLITEQWLLQAAQAAPEGVVEIMTHPGLAEDLDPRTTRLLASRRVELEALCSQAVRQAFAHEPVELIHYGQLRSSGT